MFICIKMAAADKDSSDKLRKAIEAWLRATKGQVSDDTDVMDIVFNPPIGLFNTGGPKVCSQFLAGINEVKGGTNMGTVGDCKCPLDSKIDPELKTEACLVAYEPPKNPKIWDGKGWTFPELLQKYCPDLSPEQDKAGI